MRNDLFVSSDPGSTFLQRHRLLQENHDNRETALFQMPRDLFGGILCMTHVFRVHTTV